MPPLEYERPESRERAVDLLAAPGAYPLGGGTDLLVTMREGLVQPRRVVDLRGIPGADSIEWRPDGSVLIGAAVRLVTLAEDRTVGEQFPALAMACESVGSPALRNMGTLGGNLCQRPRCWYLRSGIDCLKSGGSDCPAMEGENQHHAIFGGGPCHIVHPSDPAVALTALDATVHVVGQGGERVVPIAEFFVLPKVDLTRETVLEAGEVVAAIAIPDSAVGGRQRFVKVLQRGAWDFALASCAVARRRDGSVRLVLGGVAPVPWRVNPSVEEDVASAPLAEDDLDTLAMRALHDAKPLAKNGYKVVLAHSLLREAMAFASAP